MTEDEQETLSNLLTERLLATPGVLAVYPRRTAESVAVGILALASKTPPAPRVWVREDDGAMTVEATLGIAAGEPARAVVRQAYDRIRTVLEDCGIHERRVLVRVATVD